MYKMTTKNAIYPGDIDGNSSVASSGSDFDEDEDPDEIEVPGGGKDLATAAVFGKKAFDSPNSEEDSDVEIVLNGTSLKSEEDSDSDETEDYSIENMIDKSNAEYHMKINSNGIPSAPDQSTKYYSGNMGSLLAQSNTKETELDLGGMNFGYENLPGSSMGGPNFLNPIDCYNKLMLKNIQDMLNANPSYLTSGIPNKLLSQMWAVEQNKFYKLPSNDKTKVEIEEEDDEMGVAETYADYWPLKLKLGKKHPDPVVETASLSSVEPMDVYYKLSLPFDTINNGSISALQLESITYASQAHDHLLPDGSRAGFLVGDGAGVGKGRTIAGIIFENYLKGRKKALWISVSNDLKYDAARDFKDIGANKIKIHALNKLKYAKINSTINDNIKKGVIFSTYSAMIGESQSALGKYKTRLNQLLQWCGEEFDGVIIFDECHKAKNLCPVGSGKPTKTGLVALELQNKLPNARVVYASATGASEPRNMAYMVRLGIWGQGTPFPQFSDFITAVEKRGVGAMEIVAMDMKLRGMYIARQLSFRGVTFKIEEIPLTASFKNIYDKSVELWVEAMQKFTEAAELIDAEKRMKKTMWGQFWSAHQRFFKYLCIASKVNHVVTIAREAIKYGKCVVIGLQSTGEARTLEQLERDDGELNDFVSTAKGVFQSLVEKHFPAPDRSRIHRLLGLDNSTTILQPNLRKNLTQFKKRKNLKRQTNIPKKQRRNSSDSGDMNSDVSSGTELKLSESEHSNNASERSEVESDYNPFKNSGSGSDSDPWVNKSKKLKKKAKMSQKKKTTSTQDKIEAHLSMKKSSLKVYQLNNNEIQIAYASPPADAIKKACAMKEELLEKIEFLGESLPANTLDKLIDELGGPGNVAEMTGRKGRVVQTEDGNIHYETRSEQDVPLETLNLTEKQRFMNGEKDVAIISEAASSGISLQSDRRVRNQRRRVHITLELPWSADRAIQQFGRTHRSNQVNAPEYIFLISDLAGERRFASSVAKRLESLGALTHGDRRATETRDLSQFNIDNKYGKSALETVMRTIMGYEKPLVEPPKDYEGDFIQDIAGALVGVGLIVNNERSPGVLEFDKDYNSMSKFLNRILGMPVELQNRLFKYFTDTLAAIISKAKKVGGFDLGILDLGAAGQNVTKTKFTRFLRKHATGVAPTELYTVLVERGMSWEDAYDKGLDLLGGEEGFYASLPVKDEKRTAILAVEVDGTRWRGKKTDKKVSKEDFMFQIYRPNTGLQIRHESFSELKKSYRPIEYELAKQLWVQHHGASVNTCSHSFFRGNCRNVAIGLECEVGLRRRSYTVLSGSVLSVWSRVEQILSTRSGQHNKMQVIRLKTKEGTKIVGILIPKNCVELLMSDLSVDAEKVEAETFPLE